VLTIHDSILKDLAGLNGDNRLVHAVNLVRYSGAVPADKLAAAMEVLKGRDDLVLDVLRSYTPSYSPRDLTQVDRDLCVAIAAKASGVTPAWVEFTLGHLGYFALAADRGRLTAYRDAARHHLGLINVDLLAGSTLATAWVGLLTLIAK